MEGYRVKVLNSEGKLTMSRLMDRESAERFADRIWNSNSLISLESVIVEDRDGMIVLEFEV